MYGVNFVMYGTFSIFKLSFSVFKLGFHILYKLSFAKMLKKYPGIFFSFVPSANFQLRPWKGFMN